MAFRTASSMILILQMLKQILGASRSLLSKHQQRFCKHYPIANIFPQATDYKELAE